MNARLSTKVYYLTPKGRFSAWEKRRNIGGRRSNRRNSELAKMLECIRKGSFEKKKGVVLTRKRMVGEKVHRKVAVLVRSRGQGRKRTKKEGLRGMGGKSGNEMLKGSETRGSLSN